MPFLTNSIGLTDPPNTTFNFWTIRGVPQLIYEQGQSYFRFGVDGLGIVRTGKRNNPFTLRTEVDATNHFTGAQLYEQYLTLANAGQVTIVKNSVIYGQFHVLNIQCAMIKQIAGIINGVNVPNGVDGVMVVCNWQLAPEATTPEEPPP